MPGEKTEGAKSVQDIAALIIGKVDSKATQPDDDQQDDSPLEGTDLEDTTQDDTTGDDTVDGDDDTTGLDADADQDDGAADADEGDDEADQDEDDGDDQSDAIEIRDDDTIEVMVDGKLEVHTIAELKAAMAGKGAIDKRLKEATEVRKAAHAERTSKLEALAEQERLLANSLAALEDSVFVAVIPPPDAKMKDTNPAAYLRHKDAYDTDQARIATAKTSVQEKIKEFAQKRKERLDAYGADAAKEISRLIPELTDPKKSPVVLQKLAETAKIYGYSEAEIASALDPRMFHLVRDAMLYRDLTSRSKEKNVTDVSKQGDKTPRRLRSGGTRAATVVQAKAKQQAKLVATAQQTGSVKDVAAMLLRPKGK